MFCGWIPNQIGKIPPPPTPRFETDTLLEMSICYNLNNDGLTRKTDGLFRTNI